MNARIEPRSVLVTGATGYMGTALVERLVARGHRVKALVRAGSETRLARGVQAIAGDPLDAESVRSALVTGDTLVHLVGTRKPAPWKKTQFRAVDLASLRASVAAAQMCGAAHFVYVSVAQPAPVMRAYIEVRAECEAHIRAARLDATILRPWYVIGPGHRWPIVLVPLYALLERLPATRASAQRLGLVKQAQMVGALVHAVENPVTGTVILDTLAIRSIGSTPA